MEIDKKQINEEVVGIMREVLVDNTIALDTRLDISYFDMIDAVSCVMRIEEKYGIQLDDNVISRLKTVQEWCDYIEKLIKEK